MLTAALLALSAISAPPPADYVLVPVAPQRIVVRDYVVFPFVRSVVVRRTVLPAPVVIRREYVTPPRVVRYYESEPYYVPLQSGFYYCPSCR